MKPAEKYSDTGFPGRWDSKRFLLLLVVPALFFALGGLSLASEKRMEDFEARIEARQREIETVKLSAAEPFLWKPLLNCTAESAPREGCIPVTISWKKETVQNPEANVYTRSIASPDSCLICHRAESGIVQWTFKTTPPGRPPVPAVVLYGAGFLSLLVWALLLWYRFREGEIVVLSAISFPDEIVPDDALLKKLIPSYGHAFYREKGSGYLRWLSTRHGYRNWFQKIAASGKFADILEQADVGKASMISVLLRQPRNMPLPVRSLEKGRMLVKRVPPGFFLLQNSLESLVGHSMHLKQLEEAVWKRADGKKAVFKTIPITKRIQEEREKYGRKEESTGG